MSLKDMDLQNIVTAVTDLDKHLREKYGNTGFVSIFASLLTPGFVAFSHTFEQTYFPPDTDANDLFTVAITYLSPQPGPGIAGYGMPFLHISFPKSHLKQAIMLADQFDLMVEKGSLLAILLPGAKDIMLVGVRDEDNIKLILDGLSEVFGEEIPHKLIYPLTSYVHTAFPKGKYEDGYEYYGMEDLLRRLREEINELTQDDDD